MKIVVFQRMVNRERNHGAAIISVLLVLTVLTVMVVAFLQSMRIDRLTARSYLNKTRAEMVARAGTQQAIQRLREAVAARANFAVGYEELSGGRFVPIVRSHSSYNIPTNPTFEKVYLLSTSTNSTAPPAPPSSTLVDINKSSPAEPGGWIGSPVSNGTLSYRTHHAPWVYILQDPNLTHQPDPAQAGYNPYIARYAYWIEDESSRIDLGIVGNKDGSVGEFERSANSRLPQDIDFGALPLSNGSPLATGNSAANSNQEIYNFFRGAGAGVPDLSLINRASTVLGSNLYETMKFYGTMRSLSNELSSFGTRRTNLNAVVTNVGPGDALAARKITADLDDIIFAITGAHSFAGVAPTDSAIFATTGNQTSSNAPLPNFGTRFYSGVVTSARRAIYLRKLAANIRDYIDTDSQPTFVNAGGVVSYGTKPTLSWKSGTEPQALGKEAIPYLQEHMWRGKETAWSRVSASTIQYTLEFSHYFEFFNCSTKDWTAPTGTFLRIYNQPTWIAGTFASIRPADIELDLGGEVFPAGKVTVVTTDPSPPPGMISSVGKTIIKTPPASAYRFSGRSDQSAIINGANVRGVVRLDGRNSPYTDYQSEMVFGVPTGYLDAFAYLTISASTQVWAHSGIYPNSNTSIFFSSSMQGNSAADRSGDARTLSEHLAMRGGSSSLDSSSGTQTRFYGGVERDLVPADHSFGLAAIGWTKPPGGNDPLGRATIPWPDYNILFDDTPNSSIAVVRDAPMQSIGELGNIFDPMRVASTLGVDYSRGGGRTLRVGQYDDVGGSARYSTAWNNGAWRLCDLFSADADTTKSLSDATVAGKININGVLRDNGLALRAALRNLKFNASPNSDPGTNGQSLTNSEIDLIIDSIKSYLTSNGLMMERGELGLISYFNPSSASQPKFAGKNIAQLNDRAREEVFRRMIELITTRSASFSVYVLADAVRESATGVITRTARHRIRTGVEVKPVIGSNPLDKATGYETEVTYESP
ncbi:MAG: hypothetical protein SFU85_05555 [Candidatus Methylacidiphilales bacterium]|nr:hypothetical protein [Candidatus Methylacidiphilales bacterium]